MLKKHQHGKTRCIQNFLALSMVQDKQEFIARFLLADKNTQYVLCVQWERYMRCDGTPDPAVQQDINTYTSLWRDDPEVNIAVVLKQCNLALQVCTVCVEEYV